MDTTPPPKISDSPDNRAAVRRRPGGRRRTIVTVIVALAVIVAAGAMLRNWSAGRALAAVSERLAVPLVTVIRPQAAAASQRLELPGSLSAFVDSPIYARSSGYLLRLHADIGKHVRRGELLAEIDSPEVDQELAQTRAQLQEAQASLGLARTTAERWQNLRARGLVAQQDADEKQAAYVQLQATVRSAAANLERLKDLEKFKRVVAPFDGVITRRDVDVGTLINAGTTNPPLFQLAQIDPLRVFVNVPQTDSAAIRDGLAAWVELAEMPGRKFEGTVTRNSGAIDPKARTLLTEIDVPNHDGRLLPGTYGKVFIEVPLSGNGLMVPVASLLFRAEGPRVAVVKSDNHIELRPIVIGRTGTMLEVVSGLGLNDRIVMNPGDSLDQGQLVRVQ